MNATMPERPETLEAQLQWLVAGKRKAVLVTPGARLPEIPAGFECVATAAGLVIFNARCYFAAQLKQMADRGYLAAALGYGVNGMPKDAIGAVTVRAPDGTEKQAVVVNTQTHPAARAAAQAQADPGDRVTLESCEHVVRKRAGCVLERCVQIRPLADVADLERLKLAAAEDRYTPILPSLIMERDGEVIGCADIYLPPHSPAEEVGRTLPIWHVWLRRGKVRARESVHILNALENVLRAMGVQLTGMLLAPDSVFVGLMEKFQYQKRGLCLLYLKHL